ncbi:RNA-binding protein 33-like isoform X2 [Zootermopsis nevadensis]|uniref:RNA-binding protein 33-like isoform X2 n=1 Tax=Zootermopsis nevadensis TaxID=136037 RepID=UPI000B8E309B|nr:RNA-binding protein 33-like isoform X2 [Zootermopsis nevadensis]
MDSFANSDDTLLEGDLGDDVDYDLGNEDEDALLADDYDVQGSSHRSVYLEEQEVLEGQDGYRRETEEPFDDVLDLGVTEGDALDDLDSEPQETQEPVRGEKLRHAKDPNVLHRTDHQNQGPKDTSYVSQSKRYVEGEDLAVNQGATQVESEEEEEGTEESRGDRFKTERTTIVSLKASNKSYGNIPDSLDNVCVEDAKQMARRDGTWRGGRRGRGGFVGRGGGPRPQFPVGAGNLNIHPLQQQQQGFVGPRFGPGNFVHPAARPGARGGMYGRPQLNQQQSPHKILINPHFRGAVQPHPEARLIWDTEMPANQTLLQSQPQALMPVQPLEPAYQTAPPGGGYAGQQFQPPSQHDPHQMAPPLRYDSPSQQGGYYHMEQPYAHFFQEQCSTLHWQDSRDPLQQVGGDMYAQPTSVPIGMESNMQHSPVFHHPNHGMGEPSINHGQHVFGGGMMQYETVSQQQGMFHEALPPQQHYHPPPSAVSPGNHHPPPPVMMEANVWHCATDGSTDDSLQLVSATHPVPSQYHSQGIYRLPPPSGAPGPMKFRQPGPVPYRHPAGPGYVNQGGRSSRAVSRFPPGIQMNVQQQQIQLRHPPSGPVHQQNLLQQPVRSPKKRSSFDAGAGGNTQFKQVRFDVAAKRKKRMPDMSNLHEVQTVDMLPSDMNSEVLQPEEEEDEETREYRKKIEQQKQEREKFLQLKEERRKLAALEKLRELQRKDVDIQAGGDASKFVLDPPQGNAIATIVNRNTVEPQPVIHHPVVRQVVQQQMPQQNIQAQNLKNRVSAQQQPQLYQDAELPLAPPVLTSVGGGVRQVRGGRGAGRGRGIGRGHQGLTTQQQQQQQVVALPPQQMKVLPAGQRIVRAPQPGNVVNQPATTPRRLVLAQSSGHQVAAVPRQVIQQPSRACTVVLRGANSGVKPVQQQQPQQRIVVQQQGVPTRQTGGGRSVVTTKVTPPQQQDVGTQQPVLPRTKVVSVENLAASTTEQQLKTLCQGIGVLENIQMLPKQRRAVLRFTNPTSAATFYKRYQRKIIDLSLISVSLVTQ